MSIDRALLRDAITAAAWHSKTEHYTRVCDSLHRRRATACPTASVIIVSCVPSVTVVELCRFLEFQRATGLELIFVDNGCGPSIANRVSPYADLVIRLSINCGACTGRNIGALFAKAPLVIFLDDDAIPAPNIVSSFLQAFNSYDVVSIRGRIAGKTNNTLNELAFHYDLGGMPFPYLVNTEGVSAYQKDAFIDAGGWADDLCAHEGIELSLRLFAATNDMTRQMYSPDPLILHDFAIDEAALKAKRQRQQIAQDILATRHPDWSEYRKRWEQMKGQSQLLPRK